MNLGDWMATPKGAKIVGYVFGFGASIVIIGALFKIQHWPFASVLLTAGMGTEAVLFAVTAFGKPHRDYHWEKAFPALRDPELDDIEEDGIIESSSIGNLSSVPSLSDEDVKNLSLGIAKLSTTASQISDLSTLSNATSALVTNISAASDSVASFTKTQVQINASSESLINSYKGISAELGSAKQSTDNFISTMNDVNKNLSAINSIYEIQLKSVSEQSDSIKTVNAELGKINSSISSSLKDVEAFKDQASKMSQQITSLNTVYGNMLNALSI